MTVTWLPLAWIVGPWELVHQHQTNSLEPEEWGPARKDLRGCARQPGMPRTRFSAPDFSAGSIHSPTSLSSVIMPGERGTEHLAPRIQADVDTRLCFSAQFIGPASPLGEGHLLWLYFCGWSAKDPVLPWLPLPREESSEMMSSWTRQWYPLFSLHLILEWKINKLEWGNTSENESFVSGWRPSYCENFQGQM